MKIVIYRVTKYTIKAFFSEMCRIFHFVYYVLDLPMSVHLFPFLYLLNKKKISPITDVTEMNPTVRDTN